MIRKSYPFNLSYHLRRHVYHAAASLPSGKPSSGTWRQIQHTVSTSHYTPQRTQSTHKMMTLCDTRREPNDSYPIPRVIFKERPSLLIPTPTQRRWLLISPPPPCSPCAQGCCINHFPHSWEVPTLRHDFPSYAAYLDMSEENGKETGNVVAPVEWLPDGFLIELREPLVNLKNRQSRLSLSNYHSPSRQDPLERNEGISPDCINVIVLE